MSARVNNSNDPLPVLLRREARTHFIACCVAFLVLLASRYAGLRAAGADAILLTPSRVGLVADFGAAVLMLTFFRVLYGIPLWFVRPIIRRVGSYVLFTLVFGVLFTLRAQHALGARIEQGSARVFYPFPTASVVIPLRESSPPQLHETSAVAVVALPDPPIRFVPAFQFDSEGQARLRFLFKALMTATEQSGEQR